MSLFESKRPHRVQNVDVALDRGLRDTWSRVMQSPPVQYKLCYCRDDFPVVTAYVEGDALFSDEVYPSPVHGCEVVYLPLGLYQI